MDEEKQQQERDVRLSRLWLKLVSEPRILRIAHAGHAKKSRVSIDRTLSQAQFPFSSHIHSYLSSYKDECKRAWTDDKVPIIESGIRGQQKFTTEMQNRLHAANLSVPIDNLPENLVRKLSNDIVLLESTRLGLRRHGNAIFQRLIKFVDEFLWKSSNDVHEHALRARKPRKNKKKRVQNNEDDGGGLQGLGDEDGYLPIDAQESSSDDNDEFDDDLEFMPDSDDEEDDEDENKQQDGDEDGDEHKQDEKQDVVEEKKENKQEEEEDEVEEQTVQIHEVYATLWANEKIILQCIDVLSVLKSSPILLARINREWTADRDLGQCLAAIMTRLLDELHQLLIQATKKGLKERVDYLLSTSSSFESLLKYLGTLTTKSRGNTVIGLRKKWNIIRLSMICVSACPGGIPGTFINDLKNRFGDHRFDNIQKLGALIQNISDALPKDIDVKDKNETLQWFIQNYIRFFAFSSEVSHQFAQSLIQVIAEEKENEISDELQIEPNSFTKFEIASQFLNTISENKNETLEKILSNTVEDRELKSIIASLLSRAHEQHLHHLMRSKHMGDTIGAPPRREVIAANNKLNESFAGTKLAQVLALSECKVILYYFIRYLQSILDRKGSINETGIWYQEKKIRRVTYLQAIGSILKIAKDCDSTHIRYVKQGLQYFFVSEIWNMGGAQKAIQLVSKSVFPKILGLELFKDDLLDDAKVPEYVPKDNIFYLLDDADKISAIFENAIAKDQKIKGVQFNKRYFVHLFGAIFNRAYLRGGSKRFSHTVTYLNQIINHTYKDKLIKQRLSSLLTNLLCNNSPDSNLKLKSKRTLEEVQMIRLCLHFVSVVISVPINPFSKLFHQTLEMKKEYLPGMPEDSSAALLKVMAGHGVWLCPNDHVYFVGNCTATNGSGKCQQCGAPIGNKVGARSHTAATGNRRIGKIDKNGKIVPDNPYSGATEGMAEYNSEKLAPRGYVLIEGSDDVVRGLNELEVRIVRWMNNAVLFIHASEIQTSCADEFTLIRKEDVTKRLKQLLTKCIRSLATKLNLSFESVVYLMHQIIHNFYMIFPAKYGDKGCPKLKDSNVRKVFEDFLVKECIKPCTTNVRRIVGSVREKVSKSRVVLKWNQRFSEQIDLESEDGRAFFKNYLPNIFLPFRVLTLSTFKEKLKENKENRLKYPVTWGILNTIDEAAGYSVFALKYLPSMITWMKLIKLRLNQRLNLDEVLADPDKYSCRWVMEKCKHEGWGDTKVWIDAFNGFVSGWNHLAARVTIDKNVENLPIDTVTLHNINIPDANNDDEKKGNNDDEKKVNDEEQLQQIRIARKNQFKKFIKIANVCEALPIKPIVAKSKKKRKILPVDVPLIYGMDTGINGKLDSSIMIRKMIHHYITVNNKTLRECYQLRENVNDEDDYDDGRTIGLQPGLDSTHISRPSDVVDIDEEEFREIIQECTQQKLKYGDAAPYTLNLRLLETRLRERYITGRKFVIDTPIEFEFAGQFNIPQVISKVNMQYERIKKVKYFDKAALNLLAIVKINIQQRAALNNDNIGEEDGGVDQKLEDDDERERKQQQKQRTLDAYTNALQAVEQTLIALERQVNLPSKMFSLGTYMKDNLHLYPQEYDPFIRTQLSLKHLENIWRYLERLYLIEEGTWHEIPQTTMELYKTPINNEGLKTNLQQFITRHEMDQLWLFLSAFRRFLENNCRTELAKDASHEKLFDFLQYADDVEEELMYVFPQGIMLNQAGYAYYHAARYYQERNDREAQDNNID